MPQVAMPHVYLTMAMIAVAFLSVYAVSLVVDYVNLRCEEATLSAIASELSARLSEVYAMVNLTPLEEVFVYREVDLPVEVNHKPYEVAFENEEGVWYVVAYLATRNFTRGKAPLTLLVRPQTEPINLPDNVIFAHPLKSNVGKPVVWAWKSSGEVSVGFGYSG